MRAKRLTKWFMWLGLAIPALAQVAVTPIVQPHMTFVNASGAPCAGCSLFSYAAGTTTPLATFTDSTGTSQNTNPIVLDAAGGPQTPSGSSGAIWLVGNSYKFILKDTFGATIWTVDNVNSGQLLPCSSANAVQTANSSVNGLTCDPTITINTSNHTINIGTLPAGHVTIGALGTPTSWSFDTTSPATALASLGAGIIAAGTSGQIAIYTAANNNLQGSSAIPAGITATTQAAGDNSTKVATTAYVATPGAISPNSVTLAGGTALTGNQGNGASVQHSTGTTTTNDCVKYDANGNTIDAGHSCLTPQFATTTDVTASRSFGSTFTNSSTTTIYVSGFGTTNVGGDTSQITCTVNGIAVWSQQANATVVGASDGFTCMVPPGATYSVTTSGTSSMTLGKWTETQ